MDKSERRFITFLQFIFSIMSFIGTIGLFSYFGNTYQFENQVIAYAGLCIAGTIGLSILLLASSLIKDKE